MKLRLRSIALSACVIGPSLLTCGCWSLRVAPAWQQFGKNPLHTAVSDVRTQPLRNIHWTAPVDTVTPGTNELLHYGSPVVTLHGTVLVPTKTTALGGFEVRAYDEENNPPDPAALHPLDVQPFWSFATDYVLPPHTPPKDWVPTCGIALRKKGFRGPLSLAVPGAGGTVHLIDDPDNQVNPVPSTRVAFYGSLTVYTSNSTILDATVEIDTPITVDSGGNLYFGFMATNAPLQLQSGIARISAASNTGTWISASAAAGNDPSITRMPYNSAPVLSPDGQSLYVALSEGQGANPGGFLVKLRSSDLAPLAKVRLKDVLQPTQDAILYDDATASPVVGPDGDVYFGVYDRFDHQARGWLLHFDADLTLTKLPGAFGWDTSPSIVSAALLPSYPGPSAYLLFTKYNDYAGAGGTGVNKLAILDPNSPMVEASSGATVMNEVRTIAGPTPDPDHTATNPAAVKEWCINSAAIDPYPIYAGGFSYPSPGGLLAARPSGYGGSALVNSEDGRLYRWLFDPNVLMSPVKLTDGLEEAYTPTLVGPRGTVFAINDRILFAVGE